MANKYYCLPCWSNKIYFFMFNPHLTLNCAGQLVSLAEPIIMGILNVTPDSFFDGGRYDSDAKVLEQAERMLTEGAKIIDVGAMSSRPGAEMLTAEEETKRLLPVIKSLTKTFPKAILSVDTFRAETARHCVQEGAAMINDISGGALDDKMYETVAALHCIPYVLMHMKGTPQTMQKDPTYEDVSLEVLDFFIAKSTELVAHGVKDVILDPGFGFGKTVDHNYELLQKMHVFKMLDWPILAGLSRKSMIYKVLDVTPEEALNGTSVLNMAALQQGAKILRVHDVAPARETIKLFLQLDKHIPKSELISL